MEQTTVAQPGTVPLSTSLDPQTVPLESGGGRVAPGFVDDKGAPDTSKADATKAEPKKPVSVRETLESVKADMDKEATAKGEAAAAEAKDKVAEAEKSESSKADEKKAEKPRGEDGKFAKGDNTETAKVDNKADQSAPEKAAAGQEGADRRQSEGQHREPPARFLPEAKTKWANVPNEVKAEVHRVSEEYEAEISKAKPVMERYEQLRQFDETAKANGRDLRDSLTKVTQIEQALARNPVIGLEMILREIGPRKADGSPLSLYDVAQVISKQSPEQFANNMRSAIQQPRPQNNGQQMPPAMAAMAKELQSIRTELASAKVVPILEAFKADRSDYASLEGSIAEILKSGVIDKIHGSGLSPVQRLEQAYRMAGGQGPSSRSAPEPAPAHSEATTERPASPDAGTKSIRGAPNGGEDAEIERPKLSTRELLTQELRRLQAAG